MGVNLSYRPDEHKSLRLPHFNVRVNQYEFDKIRKAAVLIDKSAHQVGRDLLLRWAEVVMSGTLEVVQEPQQSSSSPLSEQGNE
jgi:hypothetical protein